jgi:alkanesulfonate monooxygenase SsuD/methylene tetrahydromethanopterin reductase-like flavin-dependent oxidoreductase (luciferase family)
MGAREPEKPTAEVFAEVAEQTRLADELGYAIAWFAEHHFSNYCLCASPLMLVAHCASITKKIRLGTAVVVLPLYNPARLLAEIATADSLSNGRLMLGVGAGSSPVNSSGSALWWACDVLESSSVNPATENPQRRGSLARPPG